MIIGYMVNGLCYCRSCTGGQETEVAIHVSNVSPYSQVCAGCHDILLNGLMRANNTPLCLFDPEFNFRRLTWYKAKLEALELERDWESYRSAEVALLREFFKSMCRNACRDLESCVDEINGLLNRREVSRW